MGLNFMESQHTLAKFHITPPTLNAVGSSALNNLVDGEFLRQGKLLAELASAVPLLDASGRGLPLQERLKEAKELLIFMGVQRSVVVQNCEE